MFSIFSKLFLITVLKQTILKGRGGGGGGGGGGGWGGVVCVFFFLSWLIF